MSQSGQCAVDRRTDYFYKDDGSMPCSALTRLFRTYMKLTPAHTRPEPELYSLRSGSTVLHFCTDRARPVVGGVGRSYTPAPPAGASNRTARRRGPLLNANCRKPVGPLQCTRYVLLQVLLQTHTPHASVGAAAYAFLPAAAFLARASTMIAGSVAPAASAIAAASVRNSPDHPTASTSFAVSPP